MIVRLRNISRAEGTLKCSLLGWWLAWSHKFSIILLSYLLTLSTISNEFNIIARPIVHQRETCDPGAKATVKTSQAYLISPVYLRHLQCPWRPWLPWWEWHPAACHSLSSWLLPGQVYTISSRDVNNGKFRFQRVLQGKDVTHHKHTAYLAVIDFVLFSQYDFRGIRHNVDSGFIFIPSFCIEVLRTRGRQVNNKRFETMLYGLVSVMGSGFNDSVSEKHFL